MAGVKKKRGPAPTIAEPDVRRARARGCLLGLACGEALGAPLRGRFLRASEFPSLADEPFTLIRGGGPLGFKPGQTSWATQQATCLGTVLRDFHHYELDEAVRAYRAWLPFALECPEATKLAMDDIAEGRMAEYAGRRVFLEQGRKHFDAGSLGRTAPIGVLFWADREARVAASFDDGAITHFAPQCQLTCAVFNGLIAAAIGTPKPRLEADDVLHLFETEVSLAASALAKREPDWALSVKETADSLRADLKLAQTNDPELYGPELHLHKTHRVRVPFRLALWHLFHAPSLNAAILDAANRGGDAGTNAAVVGALMGAVFGDRDLDEGWREAVLEGPAGLQGPLLTTYHPSTLLTLAGVEYEPPASE